MSQLENGQQAKPLSIFDVRPDNVASFAKPERPAGVEFFDPKPAESKDKTYRAVIRVLPNLEDPSVPIAIVRYYWFATGEKSGFRYNSPSSPNPHPDDPANLMRPYGWCPVSAFYWELMNSKDAAQENLAKTEFSMQSQYTCLIQIKADSVHPENVGKILPYRLPAALYKRMLAAMKPTEEDIKMGAMPMDMFHPVKGHDVLLKITLKDVNGQLMRDYETSSIAPTESSMMLADGSYVDQAKYATDAAYAQQINEQIIALLKEYPNVEKEFGYHEASDDIKRKVKARLANYKDVTDIWPDIKLNEIKADAAPQTAAPQTAAPQQPIDPFATAVAANPDSVTTAPVTAQPTDPFAQTAAAAQNTAEFVASIQNAE